MFAPGGLRKRAPLESPVEQHSFLRRRSYGAQRTRRNRSRSNSYRPPCGAAGARKFRLKHCQAEAFDLTPAMRNAERANESTRLGCLSEMARTRSGRSWRIKSLA